MLSNPDYNIQQNSLALPPKEETDLHRPAPRLVELDQALCIKESGSLRNDFTVTYQKRTYQFEDTLRAKKVMVEDRLDGKIYLLYQGKSLKYEEIPFAQTSRMEKKTLKIKLPRKKNWHAPLNHLWRKYKEAEIKKAKIRQIQKTGHF